MIACPSCQTSNPAGVQFCASCGTRLYGGAATGVMGECPHCRAAGQEGVFCRACDKYMLDPTGAVEKVTFNRRFWGNMLLEALLVVVTLIVGWYIWLFFTAKTSQSPAKRLLNVYIVELKSGQAVSAGSVWIRDVVVKNILFNGIIGNLTLGIGSIVDAVWVFFDKNRQTLHDKMSGTIVVYAPNGLPEAMRVVARF